MLHFRQQINHNDSIPMVTGACPTSASTGFWQRPRIIGVGAILGVMLLGLAYGLWQETLYQHWKNIPHDPDDRRAWLNLLPMKLHWLGGIAALVPTALYSRTLTSRRRRNLPVRGLQRAPLAAAGLLMICIGVSCAMTAIRLYVWTRQMSWSFLVSLLLGPPLVFCWLGGVWVWQAARRKLAHASGAAAAETERVWVRRQPLAYSSMALLAMTLANFVALSALSYLAVPSGRYDHFWERVEVGPPGIYVCLRVLFVMSGVMVSFAFWQEVTRKVSDAPPPVWIFLRLSVTGSELLFFSLMPVLPFVLSLLAGAAGGLLLTKTVKIRTVQPTEELPPIRLGDLFQWNGKAFAKALVVVLAALLTLTALLFRKHAALFLVFCVLNSIWPAVLLCHRNTTGRVRDFFKLLLIPFVASGVLGPLIWEGTFKPDLLLSTIPIGVAACWFLIKCGEIRPRIRN